MRSTEWRRAVAGSRLSLGLGVLLVLSLPAVLAAQESDPRAVQPERPTVATHAHTVAPGYVEIEAGIEGDRTAPGERAFGAPIVTKVGLGSHLQLNLGTPVAFSAPGRSGGIGDLSAGIKWRLLDNNPVLGDFAILPAVKFPSGSVARGTGTGTTDVGITAISSHEFGPLAMDLNVAYTRIGSANGVGATDAALWTTSFGYTITPRVSWVLELFGTPTIDGSGDPSPASVLTGPVFLLDRSLSVDFGVIAPFHGDTPNSVYAGFVWNLGRM